MAVLAFPTAEGFGRDSVGGRGGTIYLVTNLNDSGAGSLRAALEASGARIALILIDGTITLLSNITVTNPYLTVFGQTAPNQGLLLRDYQIGIQTHNVTMRYFRARCGLGAVTDPPGRDTNGFLIFSGTGPKHDIILDHLDVSWHTDQNGPDIYAWAYNVTIQWCAIGEGTVTGSTELVSHNDGSLLGAEPMMSGSDPGDPDDIITVSLHNSYYHSVNDRTPLIKCRPWRAGGGNAMGPSIIADVRNTLIYNCGGPARLSREFYTETDFNNWVAALGSGAKHAHLNYIGNVMKHGPQHLGGGSGNTLLWVSLQSSVYPYDNIAPNISGSPINGFGCVSVTLNQWNGDPVSPSTKTFGTYSPSTYGLDAGSEFTVPSVLTVASTAVKARLLDNASSGAGCVMPVGGRDSVLERWITEYNAGTGNSNITHSDYPTLGTGTYPTYSQPDGIPNSWKTANGYSNSVNYTGVPAANGYDVVENYANSLVETVPGVESGQVYQPRLRGHFSGGFGF